MVGEVQVLATRRYWNQYVQRFRACPVTGAPQEALGDLV